MRSRMKEQKYIGGLFSGFLREEWIYEDLQADAIKRVLAWELEKTMEEKKISKWRWPGV